MSASRDVFSQYSGFFTSSGSNWTHNGGGSETGVLVIVTQAHNSSDVVETISVTHGGVSVPAITGSPFDASAWSALNGLTHHVFFLGGSTVTQGSQSIVVTKSGSNPCLAAAYTYNTASNDPFLVASDVSIDSGGVVDPSDTLALGGEESVVVMVAASAHNNLSDITPLSGWTSSGGTDAGTIVVEWYEYDTVGTSDVTYGWTQANDEAFGGAFAVGEESGGSSHSLLADDVESDSEVSSPSIEQVHDLAPTSVESASEVSSPAITQVHGLTADDVESASEVSSPALSESHSLTADDVESASEVTAPSIGQVHAITADDVESASSVGSPALTQVHALTADDVESASEVSAPNLAVGADHNLLADDIESASEVSAPALAQVHALLAEDIESASEVSSPSVDDGTVQPSLGKKGGRSRRTIRYIVEIDGERIPTASIQEAEALLSQAVEVAEESADRDVRRSIRIKPPRIAVRTGSGKQTASVSLQRTVKRSQARVAEIYDKARERIETEREISRLIQRRLRDEDEEEAILALLL